MKISDSLFENMMLGTSDPDTAVGSGYLFTAGVNSALTIEDSTIQNLETNIFDITSSKLQVSSTVIQELRPFASQHSVLNVVQSTIQLYNLTLDDIISESTPIFNVIESSGTMELSTFTNYYPNAIYIENSDVVITGSTL